MMRSRLNRQRRVNGAGGRSSKTKYRMPESQRPDRTVARSTKRLPRGSTRSRWGTVCPGSASTGRRIGPPRNAGGAGTRARLGSTSSRCVREWKAQQKILWTEVRKETVRWKDRWKIRDLLADERCRRAVLGFLTSSDVGRRVPAEEVDTVSEVSEAEVPEWEEGQVRGRGRRSRAPGGVHHYSCPRLTSWRPRKSSS